LLPILACNDEFEPEDLDIYVPEHHAYELYLILLEENYFISETSSNMHLGNPCISGVLLLTHQSKEDLCINLIMTSSPSPVTAIIHSSSTHTMNFINKHGIFCTYPELTSNKLALSVVHPTRAQVLDLHRIITGTMVPKFVEGNILDPLHQLFRQRYQEHGFSFDDKLLLHVCTIDALCPHTLPFVQNADGIWSQTPLDSCPINLHPAWMAGLSDLGQERSNPAAHHLAHRFPVYVYMT